jgi:hypothetical protein
VLSLTLVACNEGGGADDRPVVVFDNFDGGGEFSGCVSPSYPEEQPDLFVTQPPRFLLANSLSQNNSTGQAQVDRGETIQAEVSVNAATKQMRVELADNSRPERIIAAEDLQTPGNESIELFFLNDDLDVRGRFYMRIYLCTADCRDMQVLYDLVPCDPLSGSDSDCGIAVPYQRTLFIDGEVVQTDDTCIDFDANPGIGSGTVVIQ